MTDKEITYPVSQKLTVGYSPYEDRLVVDAPRMNIEPVTVLLTRRMVIIMLQQILNRLGDLSDLQKTPSEYWQDVLQMSHHKAMEIKKAADEKQAQSEAVTERELTIKPADGNGKQLFLATEITLQLKDKQLLLALKGLKMPEAMREPSPHLPVLAIQLQRDNVHQLIELLISRSNEANWNLPVELPWIKPDPVKQGIQTRREN